MLFKSFTLPDGRTLHVGSELPEMFTCWVGALDEQDGIVIGWPLSDMILDAIGLDSDDEPPDWFGAFFEQVLAEVQRP